MTDKITIAPNEAPILQGPYEGLQPYAPGAERHEPVMAQGTRTWWRYEFAIRLCAAKIGVTDRGELSDNDMKYCVKRADALLAELEK